MQRYDSRNSVVDSTVHGALVQADRIDQVNVVYGVPGAADSARHVWGRLAAASSVWDHVPASRDTAVFRQRVTSAADLLADLCAQAEPRLAADPWQDHGVAGRFLERIEWLLGEPGRGEPLDLYPVEAALFVLVPFLYRAHQLRLAAEHAGIDPADLVPRPDALPVRASFEAFAQEHSMLVARALLRPATAAPVGWWLFHRWLLQRGGYADPARVTELLELIREPADALEDVLTPLRITRLLHGLRRGPDVCNPEYLDTLRAEDRVRGPGHQRIRDQRLALLLTLAYGATVELTALPDIVAEHLGIPHPVDPGRLRETVEKADWGGTQELPTLRADCHHEAVIEGLRTYTARVDDLLHTVKRTVQDRITHAMPVLPARLSADGVVPADGVFDAWAGFRLDERRVRELLMGVQLYKDPDLAVRELYQNALDACRYRRARSEYLDRTQSATHAYDGRITFVQDRDEDGREYLECHDNGIGMGDTELRGVFSNAGARFAEQLDFRIEQAAWARLDPPVELFPNSRFGIGVLSYFMLADEIRVTTCRMEPSGTPGPLLEASIFGPGHLFRIGRLAERGSEPGTRVRLYLRDRTEGAWSSVDVLERVLGIAEFPTTARCGEQVAEWHPGVLAPGFRPGGERFGLGLYGSRVAWHGAPDGVNVVWTERGGALLVDGLIVHPAIRRGVLSSTGSGLTGVVVNLSGRYSPERLSADRSQVIDDLSDVLRPLLTAAADALMAYGTSFPDFEWLCRTAEGSVQLADILTDAAIRAEHDLAFKRATLNAARIGCFPADVDLVQQFQPYYDSDLFAPKTPNGEMPDHILVWRLLARRPNDTLTMLTEFCPELSEVGPVLPALPSDQFLLAGHTSMLDEESWSWRAAEDWRTEESFRDAALRAELPFERALDRAAALGAHLPWLDAAPADTPKNSGADLGASGAADAGEVLFSNQFTGRLAAGETVPPGHIANAAVELDWTVPEVCAALEAHGLRPDPRGLPDRPSPHQVVLLSRFLTGEWPWLARPDDVTPLYLLEASETLKLELREILRRLSEVGFEVHTPFPDDASYDDIDLFTDEFDDGPDPAPPGPVPYRLVFQNASEGFPLSAVIERYREYGFDIPLRLPQHPDALDSELLDYDSPCSWWSVDTTDTLPFAHVVVAARSLHTSPRELAERLTSYNVRVSCPDLPEGLTFLGALDLLLVDRQEDEYLTIDSRVTLQDLMRRARLMRTSLRQVVDWLTELGIPVPDVAAVIRAALERVPLPAP